MTENLLQCSAKDRRKLIINSKLNGIDYVEVVTSTSSVKARPYIVVYFFKDLSSSLSLSENNVRIEGGVKVKNIGVEWAKPPKDVGESLHGWYSIDEAADDRCLVVYPLSDGDFSSYTLRIVSSQSSHDPPDGFDLILSSIDFSFRVDDSSKFDCKPVSPRSLDVLQEPVLDYLSKDYASFRHLVLSRLASLVPNWKERNVADIGVTMAEVLSYVGDYLSYYQDAIATEAYFGTARSRISVKRHARLLDYYMHSGCNARAWVCIEAKDEVTGQASAVIYKGTKFLTGVRDADSIVKEEDLEGEVLRGAKVFEAMHDLTLNKAHNVIAFYPWGNSNFCLPKGATRASLYDPVDDERCLNLKVGDVLVFEETHSCDGVSEDKDVSHRHVVRLTSVEPVVDNLVKSVCVLNVAWGFEDALPFSLCVTKNAMSVAVAYGNVLLVDHGLSLSAERLVDSTSRLSFRPRLKQGPLTFKGGFNVSASASSVFVYDLQDVQADIYLRQLKGVPKNEFEPLSESDWLPGIWRPQQDLFSSNKFKADFVVETENDGAAVLRFGDGIHGLNPQKSVDELPNLFYGFYRIGNGAEGNVGADSITRIIDPSANVLSSLIKSLRNPMPAKGGLDPESAAIVRQNAPEYAKINERAITDVDYGVILKQKCDDIQDAVAQTRWTGSWYTVYIMVDRFGRKPIDESFKLKVLNILNRYRLSGYDLEVSGPHYVPLTIEILVTVSADSFRDEVEKTLLDVFSNSLLSNGLKGFFHPDNFTFGQSISWPELVAAIAKIDGVSAFKLQKFMRSDDPTSVDSSNEGIITMGPYEILQLDNDVNYPENGQITFKMQGGR